MMKLLAAPLALLCLALPALAKDNAATPLAAFKITLQPRGDGPAYVSLHQGKAYDEKEAAAHKADLDFVYLVQRSPGSVKRDLYNLSGKDTSLPAEVLGSTAAIVALSWDDDTVARCKTVADLQRMTGTYTANSFSFFGNLGDNAKGELENKRYIFLDAHGRMGFFSLKLEGDALILEGRMVP